MAECLEGTLYFTSHFHLSFEASITEERVNYYGENIKTIFKKSIWGAHFHSFPSWRLKLTSQET